MFFNITSKVGLGHSHDYPPGDSFHFAYTSYKYPTSRGYSHLHTWRMLPHQNAQKYLKRYVELETYILLTNLGENDLPSCCTETIYVGNFTKCDGGNCEKNV